MTIYSLHGQQVNNITLKLVEIANLLHVEQNGHGKKDFSSVLGYEKMQKFNEFHVSKIKIKYIGIYTVSCMKAIGE